MPDKEVVKDILVVEALPQVSQREVVDDKGKEYNLLTRDEALTEILIAVREIKKSIA